MKQRRAIMLKRQWQIIYSKCCHSKLKFWINTKGIKQKLMHGIEHCEFFSNENHAFVWLSEFLKIMTVLKKRVVDNDAENTDADDGFDHYWFWWWWCFWAVAVFEIIGVWGRGKPGLALPPVLDNPSLDFNHPQIRKYKQNQIQIHKVS